MKRNNTKIRRVGTQPGQRYPSVSDRASKRDKPGVFRCPYCGLELSKTGEHFCTKVQKIHIKA